MNQNHSSMKTKIISLLFALILAVSCAVPTFAAGDRITKTPTAQSEQLKQENPVLYAVSMGASLFGTALANNPLTQIAGQVLYK